VNEFEFMRSLPFGPYLAVNSPIHRLDPRTRILSALLLMIALTAARNPAALVAGLVFILLAWRVGRVPYEPLRKGWLSTLPFLLILAVLQVLFRAGSETDILFHLGPLAISTADLWSGITILLRFSAYMAILGLAAASLSEAELTSGLETLLRPLNMLRIPVQDIVLALQVTLRFFPLLAQTAERIAKAQASRGADWQPTGWNPLKRARQIIPVIVPLFVTSLRRAENMALAMDARGYGSMPERTSVVELHFKRVDILTLTFMVAFCLLLVIL